MHPETYNLNKTLVLSALANIKTWEEWANIVPRGKAKALNLSLIRLVKGLVKAWRVYLAEQGHNHKASSRRTPTSLPYQKGSSPHVEAWRHEKCVGGSGRC